MRLFFASITLGWAALASAQASAQTAFIEGHVFNKHTGVPLSGAAI
jgi:hypothetical protein